MSLHNKIVDNLESFFRFIYKWITDKDEILGEIVYTLHVFGFWTLMVLVIISHTIYPVFWFQTIIFSFILLVWLQHVVLRTCVLSSIERRLLGPTCHTMIDSLLDMFGIPVQNQTRMGITLMLSTVGVMFLGLELTARTSMYCRSLLGASVWI
jgi:hypothetical protein